MVLRLPPGRPAGSRRPLRPGRTWEPPNQEYFKCDSLLSTGVLISQEQKHLLASYSYFMADLIRLKSLTPCVKKKVDGTDASHLMRCLGKTVVGWVEMGEG
ncbi:N-Acetylgalactosaminyltransferase 7 [Manis pentadactyla]|nr:N-Acetylgalactosaminyltransferase 7 [Manis pentadactyla]